MATEITNNPILSQIFVTILGDYQTNNDDRPQYYFTSQPILNEGNFYICHWIKRENGYSQHIFEYSAFLADAASFVISQKSKGNFNNPLHHFNFNGVNYFLKHGDIITKDNSTTVYITNFGLDY